MCKTRADKVALDAARKSTMRSLNLKRRMRVEQIKEDAAEKIREVNIQYATDPERLRAKYAADDYARNKKEAKRAEKRIESEKKHLERVRLLRPYSLPEEVFSSIVQGLGAVFFIVATVLLDVKALERVPSEYRGVYFIAYTLFGLMMMFNNIMSLLHHALVNTTAKEVFKRLSHVSVFLVIITAYFSYSLPPAKSTSLSEGLKLVVLVTDIVVSVCCFVGLLMYAITGSRLELVNLIFYGVLGWSGLIICGEVYKTVSERSFTLLITAGILFTIGLVFSSLRKIKFMHAVGNLFLLSGSVSLFFSFFYLK